MDSKSQKPGPWCGGPVDKVAIPTGTPVEFHLVTVQQVFEPRKKLKTRMDSLELAFFGPLTVPLHHGGRSKNLVVGIGLGASKSRDRHGACKQQMEIQRPPTFGPPGALAVPIKMGGAHKEAGGRNFG